MRRLLFFVLVVDSLNALPQTIPEKRISVERIGIKEGLSQGMINSICQDHFGFMWFGTMDGLNRYDGYTFKVFRNNSFDSTSISGNFITSIFEDSKKRLWVGTALNGINLFLPESERFVHFATHTKPALTNNTILSIQEDKFGAVWIATQYGLNKLTVQDNNFPDRSSSQLKKAAPAVRIKYIPLSDGSGAELFTPDSLEPSFLITKSSVIWATTHRALFKIFPSKTDDEKIEKQANFLPGNAGKKSNGPAYKIAEDTTLGLVCFKYSDGFAILQKQTGALSVWNCGDLDLTMVRNQILFKDGVLWERTQSGLVCFDMRKKKVERIRSFNTEHDKIMETPFSLYQDRSGIVWIGSGGFGLLKYNPRNELFHKTPTKSISWMSATPTGGVLIFTPEMHYFGKEPVGEQLAYKSDTSFQTKMLEVTKQTTYIAVQDKEGNLWINLKGIAKYNPAKRSYSIFKKQNETTFPFILDRKDDLWFVAGTSLCRFNKPTGDVTSHSFPIAPVAESPYRFCQVIYQDAKGVIWLGTTEGLFSFTETTNQWRHYKNRRGDSTSLSTDIVFSLCDDPEFAGSYLWVGTNGGGLNRLYIPTGQFEQVGLEEGLPSMVVYGILADGDKQLWLSTNNGIACLKPSYDQTNDAGQAKLNRIVFRYYYEGNGLQSNEFNRDASCKTADGILFFGGVSGFNYFDPKRIDGNPVVPNVVITDFRTSNKPVRFVSQDSGDAPAGKSLLSKPVFLTESIELPYANNMFSFDFASLDYTAPEKNLYCYKMEGFDKEWIRVGNGHSATYTNLDPGDYTFIVLGSNSNGVWNEKGTSIRISIPAPWYMTWWFKTAVLLFSAALLYTIFLYRLKQKLKLSEIRNDIATDLHDEIGSTLNSVYIYSEVAQQTLGTASPQTVNYLKQISNDTGNMINALTDIVWTVNAKNDNLENVINRMRASAVDLFEAKGYHFHLQFTGQVNTLKLGMAKRKNFYLFYKEAINNAAKYANGRNIWITLTYKKPVISLYIKDDGRGFVVKGQSSGNGLTNMKKRAEALSGRFELTTEPGAGTTIQLSFQA